MWDTATKLSKTDFKERKDQYKDGTLCLIGFQSMSEITEKENIIYDFMQEKET